MRFMSRKKFKIMSVIMVYIFIDLFILKEMIAINYDDNTIRFISIVSSFELI